MKLDINDKEIYDEDNVSYPSSKKQKKQNKLRKMKQNFNN